MRSSRHAWSCYYNGPRNDSPNHRESACVGNPSLPSVPITIYHRFCRHIPVCPSSWFIFWSVWKLQLLCFWRMYRYLGCRLLTERLRALICSFFVFLAAWARRFFLAQFKRVLLWSEARKDAKHAHAPFSFGLWQLRNCLIFASRFHLSLIVLDSLTDAEELCELQCLSKSKLF